MAMPEYPRNGQAGRPGSHHNDVLHSDDTYADAIRFTGRRC
jgi:hypothetical protein